MRWQARAECNFIVRMQLRRHALCVPRYGPCALSHIARTHQSARPDIQHAGNVWKFAKLYAVLIRHGLCCDHA